MGRLGLLIHIATKHLLVRRRQTLVAISGVAVGVGFFLAVSALMVGSQDDFVKTLIDAAPHIIVSDEIRSPSPQISASLHPSATGILPSPLTRVCTPLRKVDLPDPFADVRKYKPG